jgi:acetyl esterase/lipase
MRIILTILAVVALSEIARAQPRNPIPLWPDGAPGALGNEAHDIPKITPHFPNPDSATGAAMVICPGGGYGGLAPHEGIHYALWLNEQGIAAFELEYRLGSKGYRHPRMLEDVARAIRCVRSNAKKWKLDPERIGVMGSSAGGHLASTALVHFDSGSPKSNDPIDRESSRPNLGILCYPVITMGEFTHKGSRRNLLGNEPDPKLIDLLSSEKQVKEDTPPTFIFHTVEDTAVPIENALQFAAGLRSKNVSFSMHVYPKGRHGLGLGSSKWDPANRHPWTTQCEIWLRDEGFGK